MRTLLKDTTAYREIVRRGTMAQTTLVLFPDGTYLRALLKECAKAFFRAEDGGRVEKLIEKESFLDCKFVPPKGEKFTVERASALPEDSLLRPVEGKKKLYVLDGFDDASPAVQNKLLKLLEEPPEDVFFLLGAKSEHGVLPTVLSRVAKIAVRPFSEGKIAAALSRNYPDETGIGEAAKMSGGVYSAAENFLAKKGELALAERFLNGEAIAVCREIEGKKPTAFFPFVRLLLRDTLLYHTGRGQDRIVKGGIVKALAARYPLGAVLAGLEGVTQAEKEMEFNAGLSQAAYTLALRMEKEREKWQRLS